MNNYLTINRVLILVALIVAVLAALSVSLGTFAGVALLAASFAFYLASLLVP